MDAGQLLMLLTARSSGAEAMQPGFGRLTSEDVMGALQGLGRGPFLAAMVLICGDTNSVWDLRKFLWLKVREISKQQRWQSHKTGASGRIDVQIANLVLIELAFGGKRCPRCGGIGHVVKEYQPTLCESCNGKRMVHFYEKDKAEFCGMTRENWSRHWSRRYITCFNMADSWKGIAEGHIKRRLSDRMNAA